MVRGPLWAAGILRESHECFPVLSPDPRPQSQETWLLMASQPPVCCVTQAKLPPSLGSSPHHTTWASGIWALVLLLGPKGAG